MRQVSSVAAIAVHIAVLAACADARADGYTNHSSSTGFNLPGVSTPSGYDEVRASDGTTCRSALGNRGAYVDVGGVATERDGMFYNGAVYGRVIVPLGQKPDRIDCGSLYQLEIERLRAEVAMMKASQETRPGDVTPASFTDGGSDPFEDGPDGGGFEDAADAPALVVKGDAADEPDEPVSRTPVGFARSGPTPPVDTQPAIDEVDPWSDEASVSATSGRGSFQWDAVAPLPYAGPIPTMRPVMVSDASGPRAPDARATVTSATDAARRPAGAPGDGTGTSLYANAYADAGTIVAEADAYGTHGSYLPAAAVDPISTGSIPLGSDRASVAVPGRAHVAGEIVANWATSRPGADSRQTLNVLERVYGPSLAVPFDDFDALVMTDMGDAIPTTVPLDRTSDWLERAFAD